MTFDDDADDDGDAAAGSSQYGDWFFYGTSIFHRALTTAIDGSSDTAYQNNDNDVDYDNDDENDDYPLQQQKAMALLPKFTSFLSLLGSACIICEVLADGRHKSSHSSINRILLSLSVSDTLFSMGWFLGVWPSPRDSTSDYQWGAVGTTRSCTVQGVILQIGWTAGPLFNLTLSYYYLLIIRYSWRDEKLKTLDPWIQGTIWTLAVGLAIVPIPLKLYNNSWKVCWIDTYPLDCKGEDCQRGDEDTTWIYALLISSIFPSYLCMILSVVFMSVIYATVRKMENRNLRWSQLHPPNNSNNGPGGPASSSFGGAASVSSHRSTGTPVVAATDSSATAARKGGGSATFNLRSSSTAAAMRESITSAAVSVKLAMAAAANEVTNSSNPEQLRIRARSRRVRSQALLFCGAFYFSFLPDAISTFMYLTTGTWYFWFDIFVYGICMPLQGLLNCLVFLRQREEMKSSYGRLIRRIVCCGVACESIPALASKSIFQTLPSIDASVLVRKSIDAASGFVARLGVSDHLRSSDDGGSSIFLFAAGRRRSGVSSAESSSLGGSFAEDVDHEGYDEANSMGRRSRLEVEDVHSDIDDDEESIESSGSSPNDKKNDEMELANQSADHHQQQQQQQHQQQPLPTQSTWMSPSSPANVPSSLSLHLDGMNIPSSLPLHGLDAAELGHASRMLGVALPKELPLLGLKVATFQQTSMEGLRAVTSAQNGHPEIASVARIPGRNCNRENDSDEVDMGKPHPGDIADCTTQAEVNPVPGEKIRSDDAVIPECNARTEKEFPHEPLSPTSQKGVRWKQMLHNKSYKGGGLINGQTGSKDDDDAQKGGSDINNKGQDKKSAPSKAVRWKQMLHNKSYKGGGLINSQTGGNNDEDSTKEGNDITPSPQESRWEQMLHLKKSYRSSSSAGGGGSGSG
jgi:hypothetical protein